MNITKHAFERMSERGITVEMLSSLLKGKKYIRKSRNGRFVIIGKADSKLWSVVIDSDLYTVITVRRSHEDEEVLWNSK